MNQEFLLNDPESENSSALSPLKVVAAPRKCITPTSYSSKKRHIRSVSNISALSNANPAFEQDEYVLQVVNDVGNLNINSTYDKNAYSNIPEYVNIPYNIPSNATNVKNRHINKDCSKTYQNSNSCNNQIQQSSIKRYPRKASPECDDLEDSSDSYLSAISHQSKIELSPESLFSVVGDNSNNTTLPTTRRYSRASFKGDNFFSEL